jgi:hypothetical protein
LTAKDTVDIIRESPLWNTPTIREKVLALAYAMEAVEDRIREADSAAEETNLCCRRDIFRLGGFFLFKAQRALPYTGCALL